MKQGDIIYVIWGEGGKPRKAKILKIVKNNTKYDINVEFL